MVAHQGLPVRAIAIAGAPTDFGPMLDPAVPFFDGKRGADVVEVAHQLLGCSDNTDRCDALATDVSPAQLSPGTVDLLIVHGESDHIVDVDQARRLFDHLQAQGATPELVIVEAGGHVPHVDEGGIDQFFDDRLLS
jgi:pimeloyl-ACP methyl ester carboxylesterase